eukprot:6214456-Pleurochrysis_carterae.AAC.1
MVPVSRCGGGGAPAPRPGRASGGPAGTHGSGGTGGDGPVGQGRCLGLPGPAQLRAGAQIHQAHAVRWHQTD